MRFDAKTFGEELQCALRFFDHGHHIQMENDPRDPRRIMLSCDQVSSTFRLRADHVDFVPTSRGCVLAIHDVSVPSERSSVCRCTDTPCRFSTRVAKNTLVDLAAYLSLCRYPHSSETMPILLTLCSKHGVMRILPERHAHRHVFEATVLCGSGVLLTHGPATHHAKKTKKG